MLAAGMLLEKSPTRRARTAGDAGVMRRSLFASCGLGEVPWNSRNMRRSKAASSKSTGGRMPSVAHLHTMNSMSTVRHCHILGLEVHKVASMFLWA